MTVDLCMSTLKEAKRQTSNKIEMHNLNFNLYDKFEFLLYFLLLYVTIEKFVLTFSATILYTSRRVLQLLFFMVILLYAIRVYS